MIFYIRLGGPCDLEVLERILVREIGLLSKEFGVLVGLV